MVLGIKPKDKEAAATLTESSCGGLALVGMWQGESAGYSFFVFFPTSFTATLIAQRVRASRASLSSISSGLIVKVCPEICSQSSSTPMSERAATRATLSRLNSHFTIIFPFIMFCLFEISCIFAANKESLMSGATGYSTRSTHSSSHFFTIKLIQEAHPYALFQ